MVNADSSAQNKIQPMGGFGGIQRSKKANRGGGGGGRGERAAV